MRYSSHSLAGRRIRERTFPIRLASIDIGSNAIRCYAVEFFDKDHYKTLLSERSPVRLGSGVFSKGSIGPGVTDHAIRVLHAFQSKIKVLGIDHMRAVATSAVREAADGASFVDQVRHFLGLTVEVIPGSEEARLVYLAVTRKVRLGRKSWILVDLGGGSAEISLIDAAGIRWTETRGVGAVRLLQEFHLVQRGSAPADKVLADYIRLIKLPEITAPTPMIATGGNIEKIASLVQAEPNRSGISTVHRPSLRRLIEKLSSMSLTQRIHQLNLKQDRADVILPAAMVYDHLADACRTGSILVPCVGLKEGVVLDLVEDLFSHPQRTKAQGDLLAGAAVSLGRRFNFEESHNCHVAKLAISLFDQLGEIHGMKDDSRNLLLAAAILHDIGTFIGYKSHHKHSLYILSQSELPSLTSRQMLIVANIARYHRKTEPQPSHPLFMKLGARDRDTVSFLASILRIADSLDKDHLQHIRDVSVRWTDHQVHITPRTSGKSLLNEWSFQKKSRMFSRIFKKKIRLIQ